MSNDDLSQIERDVIDLASASPRDDAFRRALRGELAERTGARPPAPRRLRLRRPALATAAIAALAVLAIVLLGTRHTGGPETAAAGVLAQAKEVLTPPANRIVHVRLVGARGIYHESWQLTNPPYAGRWRGTLGGGPESSDDGTHEFVYDERAGTIYSRPSPAPLALSGPLSKIRADVASGRARLAGSTTIEGERVEVVKNSNGFIAYIDPKTYRPKFVDYPTRSGLLRLRVVALEYLPRTPETMRSLSLAAQHPGVPVESNPAAWGGK
jgi:hypothetical protein